VTAPVPQIPAYLLDSETWGEPVRVWVPEEPVSKERPRFRVVKRRDGKTFGKAHTPKKTRDYEAAVAACFRSVPAPSAPFRVRLLVVIQRPDSQPKRVGARLWAEQIPLHVGRKDLDNVAKAVLDGMGAWLGNDREVVSIQAWKVCGAEPGVLIEVSGLAEGWR